MNDKIICNAWYWLTDSWGKRFKVCSMNYSCPMDGKCICGMREVIEHD